MQDVFNKNPKMGDPASLSAQLDENSQTLDKLQQEIRKYEVRNSKVFPHWDVCEWQIIFALPAQYEHLIDT